MKRGYKKIFKTKRDCVFMKKRFQRKILSTFAFSVVASVLMIVHGIFLDLDFAQIKRLSLEGFAFTFVLVFIGLLILEKIFNLEEDEEIIKIKKRLNKIEKKK
ncbi:hypothetical protein COY00_02890 [Candidatus Pacearchaeota archaeon CG_4_10_14_0_2_um_filter_35_33]|nr:MAG: hypothetical protein COY00_02890 [Candidatus Pacearchaeota archaeon CG_4_10_14_0_2_um_filter_35_33]PJA70239.1 MAG: hypothetical protein CO155_01190 [Candidatus Pacearchaeota archaeon CG_4_9_14_3_um_filter_35_19]PJB93680.1 MAG: hypothetical protein CO081_04785 [Candidatus Pacearchaeota archaeon CG_4_9_14_0_8_um_filter_35_24]